MQDPAWFPGPRREDVGSEEDTQRVAVRVKRPAEPAVGRAERAPQSGQPPPTAQALGAPGHAPNAQPWEGRSFRACLRRGLARGRAVTHQATRLVVAELGEVWWGGGVYRLSKPENTLEGAIQGFPFHR